MPTHSSLSNGSTPFSMSGGARSSSSITTGMNYFPSMPNMSSQLMELLGIRRSVNRAVVAANNMQNVARRNLGLQVPNANVQAANDAAAILGSVMTANDRMGRLLSNFLADTARDFRLHELGGILNTDYMAQPLPRSPAVAAEPTLSAEYLESLCVQDNDPSRVPSFHELISGHFISTAAFIHLSRRVFLAFSCFFASFISGKPEACAWCACAGVPSYSASLMRRWRSCCRPY